jgi:hypothetical protein
VMHFCLSASEGFASAASPVAVVGGTGVTATLRSFYGVGTDRWTAGVSWSYVLVVISEWNHLMTWGLAPNVAERQGAI